MVTHPSSNRVQRRVTKLIQDQRVTAKPGHHTDAVNEQVMTD